MQIEYSTGLLRQVRLESAGVDACGTLFGVRDENHVRVLAARRNVDLKDPRLAGLVAIGSFAARARGEIFLTESDLIRFEGLDPAGTVALVVAGNRAGFFVRQADGSMQTIRSYQEFAVSGSETQQKAVEPPSFVTLPSRTHRWGWISLGCFALLAIPLMAGSYFLPLLPRPPLGLAVREESGQLRIQWNPIGAEQQARIEIIDSAERTTLPVTSALSSATYVRRTGDVEVRFDVSEKGFDTRREATHFVALAPPVSPEIERTRVEIQSLENQAGQLKDKLEKGSRTLVGLQKQVDAYKLQ